MKDNIQAYVVNFYPLIGSLMNQVGLVDKINNQVGDPDPVPCLGNRSRAGRCNLSLHSHLVG